MKTGIQVAREIHKLANSGDPSNDILMEKIRALLEANKHLFVKSPRS